MVNSKHALCIPPGEVAATPGVDYGPIPNPSTLTFTAGVPTQCAMLDIPEDSILEPERRVFTITATGGNDKISIQSPSVATIFISEDDREFTHNSNTVMKICILELYPVE